MLDDDNATPAEATEETSTTTPPPESAPEAAPEAAETKAAGTKAAAKKTAAKKPAKKAAAKKTTKPAKKAAAKKTAAKSAAKAPTEETDDQAALPLEEAPTPPAVADAPEASTVESPAESQDEAATEDETSADPAPPTMLLFQAPKVPAETPRRTRRVPEPVEVEADETSTDDEDEASDDRPGGSSRSRGGSGGSRRPAKSGASKNGPEQDTSGASDKSEATDKSDRSDDDSGNEDSDDDSDSDQGGPRRRRRRGGRRRRKGDSGDGNDGSDSSSDSDSDDSGSDAGEGKGDDKGDKDSGGDNGGTRRRRRRRRAGEDGGGDSGDDPENTVTRVRKSRTGEDQITAVTGSTRLEAKKQRRREGREAGRRRAPIVSEAEFLARRESVERTMVIRQRTDLTQIAVLEDKVLVEHYVARESQTSLIGNVYVGRVQNVLPSMEAAFVDIGKGRNAVIYAGEVNWSALGHKDGQPRKIESVLSSGQSILVQVTKDPIGHKGARLTSQVSLAGRFLVYVPDGTTSGISRKLPDTERSRLKSLLKEIVPDTAGVIVRTAAEGASEEELTQDVERLKARWESIEAKSKSGGSPKLLYGEPDLTLKVVRDLFTEDFSKLVIEGDDAWKTVQEYVHEVAPDLEERLERFEPGGNGGDSFSTYRIDEQIAKGLDRKVWLPSGGSLIIDRTEAMTVVDVNTGKFTGSGGNLEETVTKNNLEAAEEIVRQLRLRDIGGIIVVDFIDMVLESNRDLVLRRLVECLGRDRTRHQVAEVTSLGLVQMTRKRIGTGLLESFSEDCSHCQGRGVVVHDAPIEPKKQDDDRRGGRRRGKGKGESGNGNGNGNGGQKATPSPKDVAAVAKPQNADRPPLDEADETADKTIAKSDDQTGDKTDDWVGEQAGEQAGEKASEQNAKADSTPESAGSGSRRGGRRSGRGGRSGSQDDAAQTARGAAKVATAEPAPAQPAVTPAAPAPAAEESTGAEEQPAVVTRTRTRRAATRTGVATSTPVVPLTVSEPTAPASTTPEEPVAAPTVVTTTRTRSRRGASRPAGSGSAGDESTGDESTGPSAGEPTTEPSTEPTTGAPEEPADASAEQPGELHVPIKKKGSRRS